MSFKLKGKLLSLLNESVYLQIFDGRRRLAGELRYLPSYDAIERKFRLAVPKKAEGVAMLIGMLNNEIWLQGSAVPTLSADEIAAAEEITLVRLNLKNRYLVTREYVARMLLEGRPVEKFYVLARQRADPESGLTVYDALVSASYLQLPEGEAEKWQKAHGIDPEEVANRELTEQIEKFVGEINLPEKSAKVSAKAPAKASENSAKESATKNPKDFAKKVANEATKDAANGMVNEITKEVASETVKVPAKASENSAKESATKNPKDFAKKVANEATKDAANGTVNEITKEVASETAREVAKEITKVSESLVKNETREIFGNAKNDLILKNGQGEKNMAEENAKMEAVEKAEETVAGKMLEAEKKVGMLTEKSRVAEEDTRADVAAEKPRRKKKEAGAKKKPGRKPRVKTDAVVASEPKEASEPALTVKPPEVLKDAAAKKATDTVKIPREAKSLTLTLDFFGEDLTMSIRIER